MPQEKVLEHDAILTCHPQTPSRAVHAIRGRVHRTAAGVLAVTYSIDRGEGGVKLPSSRPPRMADRLWEHTCCEMFIKLSGAQRYHEFNLAPSSEWAVYAFEAYRERAPACDLPVHPQVSVRQGGTVTELSVSISLSQLSALHARAKMSLALSAVIEDLNGGLSYWALAHPAGKPDFHHSVSYALELDEIRD